MVDGRLSTVPPPVDKEREKTNMAIENRNWWEVEPWWVEWATFGICAVWAYILPIFMLPMLVVSAVFGKIRWRVVLPCVVVGVPLYFERIVRLDNSTFVVLHVVSAVILIAVLIPLWLDGAFKRNQP